MNGLEILSQDLQWVLSHTNSTPILWNQLMERLKRYSEDIPEVALDIVSKSVEIEILSRNWVHQRRERTVTILLLNNSTYFVCHLTVIDIKQLLLHFKYIISPLLATWNYNSYSVSRVLECYRMSRPVFKLVTIVIV